MSWRFSAKTEDQTRNLTIPGSLFALAQQPAALRPPDQLLISADQVFSICLTTESGIGM